MRSITCFPQPPQITPTVVQQPLVLSHNLARWQFQDIRLNHLLHAVGTLFPQQQMRLTKGQQQMRRIEKFQ